MPRIQAPAINCFSEIVNTVLGYYIKITFSPALTISQQANYKPNKES